MIRHMRRGRSLGINLLSTAIALVALSVVRTHRRAREPKVWRVLGWGLVVLFAIGAVLVGVVTYQGAGTP